MDLFPEDSYVPKHERAYITKLVQGMLDCYDGIEVLDPEERVVQSTELVEILSALGSTGEDTLLGYNTVGYTVKSLVGVYLVYNNGSEGDPEIVVADYFAVTDEHMDALDEIIGGCNGNT